MLSTLNIMLLVLIGAADKTPVSCNRIEPEKIEFNMSPKKWEERDTNKKN